MPSSQPQRLAPGRMQTEAIVLSVLKDFVAETHPGRRIPVTLEADFERDLGLDSVSRMELAVRLQHALGQGLPDAAINEAGNARALLQVWAREPRPGARIEAPHAAPPGRSDVPFPESAQSLIEMLEWHARREPDRRHVLLPGESGEITEITFDELLYRARRRASGLLARGIQPGQTVALMLPTGREYLECFFAVMIAGAWPVPIYPPTRLSQLAEHLQRHGRILENAQARAILTPPEAKALASGLPGVVTVLSPADIIGQGSAPLPRPSADDIAFLQYTSGSTGDPKGVVLTHGNVLANIRAMGRAAKVGSEDVFVSWLPLYHDMGLIGAWLGSLYHACPLVLLSPLAFLARPARWLHALSDFGGTLTAAPNFAFDLCARKLPESELQGVDLHRVRVMFNGAEPVSPDTLDAFAARFSPLGLMPEALTPVYGLAENAVGLAFPPIPRGPRFDLIERDSLTLDRRAQPASGPGPGVVRLASCGRALPGHEIRVVDDFGRELAERLIGRVQFRGPSATAGYFRNPQASATLIQQGWLDTGDYGYLWQAELYLTGRAKDVIIRGGRHFYPYELEDAVGALDGVRRGCVAVFAASDPARGTEKLVVVAETRATDETEREALIAGIQALAADRVGTAVDEVCLVPPHTILKTSSGKIRRAATRARFEAGQLGLREGAWRVVLGMAARSLRARLLGRVRQAGDWLFGLWSWAVMLPLAMLAWPLVALPLAPRWGRQVVHWGARALLALTALRVPVARLCQLPARSHVVMVNHASYTDVLVLCAILPPRLEYVFVAKRELQHPAWMRRFLEGVGTLFVERGQALQSAQDAALMTDALLRGRSLVVFPEATFTREAGLRAFHMGGFVAAARAQVPVVTLGLRGTRAVLRDGSYLPRHHRLAWQLGVVLVPHGRDWAAAVKLREATRAQLLEVCGEPDLRQ